MIAAHLARRPHPYRRFCGCGALLDDSVCPVAVVGALLPVKVSVHFIIKFVTFVFLLY